MLRVTPALQKLEVLYYPTGDTTSLRHLGSIRCRRFWFEQVSVHGFRDQNLRWAAALSFSVSILHNAREKIFRELREFAHHSVFTKQSKEHSIRVHHRVKYSRAELAILLVMSQEQVVVHFAAEVDEFVELSFNSHSWCLQTRIVLVRRYVDAWCAWSNWAGVGSNPAVWRNWENLDHIPHFVTFSCARNADIVDVSELLQRVSSSRHECRL